MKKLLVISLMLLGTACYVEAAVDILGTIAKFDTLKTKAAALHKDMVAKDCPQTPADLYSFLFTFKGIVATIDDTANQIGVNLDLVKALDEIPFITSKGVQSKISYTQVLGKVVKLKGMTDTPTEEQQNILALIKQITQYIADRLAKGVNKFQAGKIRNSYLAIVGFFKAIAAFAEVCKNKGDEKLEAAAMQAFEAELATEADVEDI